MACKDCKFWDHGGGRNRVGAAVYAATCQWKFVSPVVPNAMWQARQEMARWADKTRHGMMEPKDGKGCPTFEERK